MFGKTERTHIAPFSMVWWGLVTNKIHQTGKAKCNEVKGVLFKLLLTTPLHFYVGRRSRITRGLPAWLFNSMNIPKAKLQ